MAHYALLDIDNVVIQVITGVDENIIQNDLDNTQVGGSSESWEEFYATRSWLNAVSCKRTSYNNNIRKQYAGVGYTYDAINDVFISPCHFASWSLDENFDWQPPTPKPTVEGKLYYWSEDSLTWIEHTQP